MDDDNEDIIIAAMCLLLSCTTQVAVTMSKKTSFYLGTQLFATLPLGVCITVYYRA